MSGTATADGRKIWEGVYDSFGDVQGDTSIFDEEIWLGKVTDRARDALKASHIQAAIAPVTESRDYALPVVAALAARPNETLRILDFGGGLATTFIPLVQMLPKAQPLEFVVVEKEKLCAKGHDLFKDDDRVRFVQSLPAPDTKFEIVHCGSSLHYVSDWREVLFALSRYRPDYLIFADIPTSEDSTFVTAQVYYGKRIPVRFWNLDEFVGHVNGLGYGLVFGARYGANFTRKQIEDLFCDFPERHRANYFSQLIFKRAT
jgi:putative methyltransferase (TIGR04325 family)